jgi:hypothetical protein
MNNGVYYTILIAQFTSSFTALVLAVFVVMLTGRGTQGDLLLIIYMNNDAQNGEKKAW